MVGQQAAHRCLQQGGIEGLVYLQHQRLVPVMRIGYIVFGNALKEPALDRRQGYRSLHDALFGTDGRAGGCDCRQGGHGRRLENLPGGQPQSSLVGQGNDLDAEDGIPTQLEKVIVDTNSLQAEHLRPDGGQGFLSGRARGDVGGLQIGPGLVGRRQCPAVYLAAGGQGQGFQRHKDAGHHILGQFLRHKVA